MHHKLPLTITGSNWIQNYQIHHSIIEPDQFVNFSPFTVKCHYSLILSQLFAIVIISSKVIRLRPTALFYFYFCFIKLSFFPHWNCSSWLAPHHWSLRISILVFEKYFSITSNAYRAIAENYFTSYIIKSAHASLYL